MTTQVVDHFTRRATHPPLRVVIEGANYSGKTSLGGVLRSGLPGATWIEVHDYLHLHMLRQTQRRPAELETRQDWRTISERHRSACVRYLDQREDAVFGLMANLQHDDVVVERMMITAFVYKALLLGVNDRERLLSAVSSLAERGGVLIHVSASEEIVGARAETREGREVLRSGPGVPWHLSTPDVASMKSAAYSSAVALVAGYVDTIPIDTSTEASYESGVEILRDRLGLLTTSTKFGS